MNHLIIFDVEGFQRDLAELYNDEVLTPMSVTYLFRKHLKSTMHDEVER